MHRWYPTTFPHLPARPLCRLRTKDVRGAIEARKAAAAEQQAALEKVLGGSAGGGGGGRAGGGGLGGIHPLERPDIPADVKVRR